MSQLRYRDGRRILYEDMKVIVGAADGDKIEPGSAGLCSHGSKPLLDITSPFHAPGFIPGYRKAPCPLGTTSPPVTSCSATETTVPKASASLCAMKECYFYATGGS